MTDNEKRAHDLAVMYARYSLDRDNSQKEEFGLTVLDGEFDVFCIYSDAYSSFLSCLSD